MRLDVNGTIENSIQALTSWLAKTSGRKLRVDTVQGRPDIMFVRLAKTEAEIRAADSQSIVVINDELSQMKILEPGPRVFAIYYGGTTAQRACGQAEWPGRPMAGVFLEQGGEDCGTFGSATIPDQRDFAMLHEVFHAMGFVDSGAPNANGKGHVTDDPDDLMFNPNRFSNPTLDAAHDDYLHSGLSRDLSTSLFFDDATP